MYSLDDLLGRLGLRERRHERRWAAALTPDRERLMVRRRLMDHSRRIARLEAKIAAERAGEHRGD